MTCQPIKSWRIVPGDEFACHSAMTFPHRAIVRRTPDITVAADIFGARLGKYGRRAGNFRPGNGIRPGLGHFAAAHDLFGYFRRPDAIGYAFQRELVDTLCGLDR